MAIAFVRRTNSPQTGGSGATIPSGAIDVDAGTLTVICGSHDPNVGNEFTTVADDGGNVWHQAGSTLSPGGNFSIAMYYAYNCNVRAADIITMSLNGAVPFRAYAVQEFSGLGNADPLADFKTGSGTTSTLNETVSTGSLTLPGGATEGVVVAYGLNGGDFSVGSGYSGTTFTHPDAPGPLYFVDEYHIVSAGEAASAIVASSPPLSWGLIAGLFVPRTVAVGQSLDGWGRPDVSWGWQ